MSREVDPEKFFAELDEMGYAKVGALLAMGRWGKVGTKYELAKEWQRQCDRAETFAADAEQTKIAREAKEAAERSAAASERSAAVSERSAAAAERSADNSATTNRRATLALALTVAGIIVQVILAYLRPL